MGQQQHRNLQGHEEGHLITRKRQKRASRKTGDIGNKRIWVAAARVTQRVSTQELEAQTSGTASNKGNMQPRAAGGQKPGSKGPL